MTILASEQVRRWLIALSPDTRKRVRAPLRGLENRRGDMRSLSGELEGFCRLRIGGLRIVYSEHAGRILRLEYADSRDLVYETFLKILEERKSW
ncbi:MAG: type II toxin-antitoxin system RelE family toxin [Limisphaerales bacterium]